MSSDEDGMAIHCQLQIPEKSHNKNGAQRSSDFGSTPIGRWPDVLSSKFKFPTFLNPPWKIRCICIDYLCLVLVLTQQCFACSNTNKTTVWCKIVYVSFPTVVRHTSRTQLRHKDTHKLGVICMECGLQSSWPDNAQGNTLGTSFNKITALTNAQYNAAATRSITVPRPMA
uniref:Uncharacterized protein n=1 Tax=Stomoxys calcitrans TaxID=35570 RepID=A0A1I8PC38_STOCA